MLARDQATLARAQADLLRARDLLRRSVVAAQQQVDQAEADAKIAAANLQARPGGDRRAIASGWTTPWCGRRSKAGSARCG